MKLSSIKNIITKHWLFIGITVIQLIAITLTFAFFKEGFHSDELYEYGFANSVYNKELYRDDNNVELDQIWTDSSKMNDYLTVDKDNRFSYVNIYKHATMNYYNPPLKLFVLHTICSLFPGVFSKWFSYSINFVCFIILQVFLYLLVYKMTKSKGAAIAAILLMGFSAGGVNSVLFLRMYIMGMAFGSMFLYFSYSYFVENDKRNSVKYLISSFISLFLGAFTLHLFLVFAFPIVLALSVFYLICRKWKKFFIYGFSSLLSVILSFLAFPQTTGDTMQSASTYSYAVSKYSTPLQFRMYWYLLTSEIFGAHTSVYSNPWIKISFVVAVFLIIVFLPLYVLLRKERWFKAFLGKIISRVKNWANNLNYSFVIIIACISSIFFVSYICALRTSINTMSLAFASRYVFMIYPCVVIASICLIYYFIKLFLNNKLLISTIVVIFSFVFILWSQNLTNQDYLMKRYQSGLTLSDIEDDANCYITLVSNWFLICFSPELRNTNSYYFVDYNDYKEDKDFLINIDKNKPFYIIMDHSIVLSQEEEGFYESIPSDAVSVMFSKIGVSENEILDYYLSFDEIESIDYVGDDSLFWRPIKIYRVHFN